MNISVVIPVYNGEKNLFEVYKRIKSVLQNNFENYEIIYVDDGSQDRTPEILKEIKILDNSVNVISLVKNVGQHKALTEGFKNVKYDIIASFDNDLECNPEDIIKLAKEINKKYDLVCGYRYKRKIKIWRRFTSVIFNILFSTLTGIKLSDIGCPLKLYRKNIVDEVIKYGDIPSSFSTFKKYKIREVKIETNYENISTYSFLKLLSLALYSIKRQLLNRCKIS